MRTKPSTGEKIITIATRYNEKEPNWSVPVPSFTVRGQWLADLGFPIGSRVKVMYEPGRIVITPLHPLGVRPLVHALPTIEPASQAAEPPPDYVHPAPLTTTPRATPKPPAP